MAAWEPHRKKFLGAEGSDLNVSTQGTQQFMGMGGQRGGAPQTQPGGALLLGARVLTLLQGGRAWAQQCAFAAFAPCSPCLHLSGLPIGPALGDQETCKEEIHSFSYLKFCFAEVKSVELLVPHARLPGPSPRSPVLPSLFLHPLLCLSVHRLVTAPLSPLSFPSGLFPFPFLPLPMDPPTSCSHPPS